MEGQNWFFKPYVIIVALISVTAVAMVLLTLMLLPRTDEILGVMQWRMVNATAFRVETDIEYKGWVTRDSGERERQTVTINTSGVVDRSDSSSTRQRHMFKVLVIPNASGDETFYRFEGESRLLGQANFLRLDRIPQKFGSFRLDRFVGRWLRIEVQELVDRIDMPVLGGRRKLSDGDRLYLTEQFRLTPFLSVVQRLKDDVVGGIDTMHYEVLPEVLFIKDYFVTAETVRKGRELTSEERRVVDRFFSNVKAETSEVWIGHSDYYLYRALFKFLYDDGVRLGTFTLTLRFSNFNHPVGVEGPEGEVQNISEIVESLLPSLVTRLPMASFGGQNVIGDGGRTGGLPVDVPDLKDADPDGDGLSNSLEFFYGSDPHNPDSDGDGMKDGEEVGSGRNPTGEGSLFDFGISAALSKEDPPAEEVPAEDVLDTGTAAESSGD